MSIDWLEPQVDDPEAMKQEWLGRLDVLIQDFDRWAQSAGWKTRRVTKTLEEDQLGSYKVPVLLMEKDTVQVVLNPVARLMPDAEGAVDLYEAPAYDDIATLFFVGGSWTLRDFEWPNPPTNAGKHETLPCDEPTVRRILDRMATHG